MVFLGLANFGGLAADALLAIFFFFTSVPELYSVQLLYILLYICIFFLSALSARFCNLTKTKHKRQRAANRLLKSPELI